MCSRDGYTPAMELNERTRADWIKWQLCRAIAKRLRREPERILKILFGNLERIGEAKGWTSNEEEWWNLLETHTPEQIAEILEAESHESQRLRSTFRGFRILPEEERVQIIDAGYGLQPLPETLVHAA
jgi:hypothetical protein